MSESQLIAHSNRGNEALGSLSKIRMKKIPKTSQEISDLVEIHRFH